MSVDEVLVYTRLAADTVGATQMDRSEDVEPNPITGKVYVACTNNTDRGVTAGKPGPDAANPRQRATRTATSSSSPSTATGPARPRSRWNLLLRLRRPGRCVGQTYFAGWDGPVTPISCPDNVAFDAIGNLWISTDGAPGTIAKADGLFKRAAGGSRARPRPAVPGRPPGTPRPAGRSSTTPTARCSWPSSTPARKAAGPSRGPTSPTSSPPDRSRVVATGEDRDRRWCR